MKNLALALLLLVASGSLAQTSVQTTKITFGEETLPSDWTAYIIHNDFEIHYKVIQCDFSSGYDTEYVVFKIENKTNKSLTFNWHMEMYYGEGCNTCDYPDEYSYSFEVAANSSAVPDCNNSSPNQLKIFSKFTDPKARPTDQLTAFNWNHLSYQITPSN